MENLLPHKYKSYSKIFYICLSASLGTFFSGYSVVYAGLLKVKDFQIAIIDTYGFSQWEWSESSYKSIIQGVIPLGSIFGALLASPIIRLFSRRNGILFTNLVTFISTFLLMTIHNPTIFLLMRLIQGFSLGIFAAIIPLYINETITPDLANLGSLTQISMAFSQLFCCIMSFTFPAIFHLMFSSHTTAIITWKILAGFPLITIILQTVILLFVFPFQTVKYWIGKGCIEEANILALKIYDEEYAKQIIQKQRDQIEMQTIDSPQLKLQPQTKVFTHQISNPKTPTKVFKTTKFAIIFAIHIGLLQQMSGVNAIVVYGKNTLQQALSGHDIALNWSTLGLFTLSIISTLITVKLMNRVGRRFLMQMSTIACTIFLGLIALSFFLKGEKSFHQSKGESTTIIISMCLFMFFYGFALGPIVWLYIPQVVQPSIVPYPVMANLLGSALCVIIFPLIERIKFIPFFFFFVWCLMAAIINQKLMVQTKDKTRQDVFQQFDKLQQTYLK